MSKSLSTMKIETLKLAPPRTMPLIARERLFAELDASTRARITTVIAGAGFGKSSLVVGWLRERAYPFIWYRLDKTDCDLVTFKGYLMAALRVLALHASGDVDKVRKIDVAWKALSLSINDLIKMIGENPLQDFFLVLDDFHQVNDNPEIVTYLDTLISVLPPNLHLFILSRQELNICMAGLSAGRELVEIAERNLCFDVGEAERLFAEVFEWQLSDEEIAAIHAMTEGWVSGLVLYCQALRSCGKGEIRSKLDTGGVPHKICEYFQHAACRGLDERLRDFLLKTSILSCLHPDFCDAFLGRSDARQCLSFLSDAHLFTIPLSEEGTSYRYYQLFRAFLQERLVEDLSPREVKELHMKAASLWEQRGSLEEALKHYMEAGDYNKTSHLLQGMVEELVHEGRVIYLQSVLSRIPSDILNRYPDLIYYRAQALEVMGKCQEAVESFLDAAALYEQRGEREAQMNCLVKMVKLSILCGKPAQAAEKLNVILDLLQDLTVDSESWYELTAILGAVLYIAG